MTQMSERFERHMPFFGKEGQDKLAAGSVAVVGVGGVGSHVVQQLALLGVGHLSLIDSEKLAESNRNRYVTARHDDPIPGTLKVDIAERLVKTIDPGIQVEKIPESLVSEPAFATIIAADYVFGCVDSEGARLVLTELCAAYARPYIDLASDILPGMQPSYGGRVCVAWDGDGCLVCHGLIDLEEAAAELAGEEGRRAREAIYGVRPEALDRSGPSVVSINGVVASLGVTEFMVAVTGLRAPKRVITHYGNMGRVAGPGEHRPLPNCYYCKGIRGSGDRADVQRYIREGVGMFLR